jgi:molybdopterin-guanine dinucleotide biosynthesis protein A
MTAHPPTSAIVLAGGRSRRLGQDKALLDLGQGPLLVHTVTLASQLCPDVVVVTDLPGRYRHLGLDVRWACDRIAGAGPLAGLEAGLQTIQHDFALLLACDYPFLDPRLLGYMLARPRDYEALVPIWEGRWHPLQAVYARSCLPVVQEALSKGERSMEALLSRLQLRAVTAQEIRLIDPQGLSLFNLNTPQDLAWARSLLAQRAQGG